jgi:hypothetical protein
LDSVLNRFIDPEGKVDYSSLQDEIRVVEDYVRSIMFVDPEELSTIGEKLAFWINAYNMLTIQGVIEEIRKNPDFVEKGNKKKLQRIRFFWWKKYQVGGENLSLYQIENDVLRKRFVEPRIHFALNCGSQSCPLLKDGLYSSENLDQELDVASTLFIRSSKGARLDMKNKTLYLSRIFKWYAEDFEKKSGSIIDFVKRYMVEEDRRFIEEHKKEIAIEYQDYDWGLNIKSLL